MFYKIVPFSLQLGLSDKRKRSRPVLLSELSSKYVNSVVCGHYHTLAITLDHKLYAWGWGIHGQLGLTSNENQVSPQMVTFFKDHRVVQAAAGYAHSAVLTSRVSFLFLIKCYSYILEDSKQVPGLLFIKCYSGNVSDSRGNQK